MNIKKIEKQLKKINQLFATIKEDGTVSAIERDLMLSYVRGLYEKIVVPQDNSSVKKSTPDASKAKVIAEVPKVKEPTPQVNNIADVVMKEVVEADQFVSRTASSPQIESNVSSPIGQAVAVQEVAEDPKPEIPQGIRELFEFESISELSDKLSRAPISDLTKCMGINEKIFTVKELFGGDSVLFAKAMETMDKFSSLEQARDYLVEHVAVDQKWSEEGKVKKAANFIKLISRRY